MAAPAANVEALKPPAPTAAPPARADTILMAWLERELVRLTPHIDISVVIETFGKTAVAEDDPHVLRVGLKSRPIQRILDAITDGHSGAKAAVALAQHALTVLREGSGGVSRATEIARTGGGYAD